MIRCHNTNKISMMRVGFLTTLIMGCVLCVAGITAIFLKVPGGETLVMSGSGMITGSGFAKAIQKRWESNDQ